MKPDEAYSSDPELATARHLQRAGRWDEALAVLTGDSPAARDLRAEILTDRHQWRLDDRTEALAAIRDASPLLARLLTAQLEYFQHLFRRNTADADPTALPQLVDDPVEEFRAVADEAGDPGLRDWVLFWYAVSSENVRDDLATAGPIYCDVLARATERGELLLASYASRHQGALVLYEQGDTDKGVELLRLSLHQRATVGARPQTAAAQAQLAMALDDVAATEPGATPKPNSGSVAGPESVLLRNLIAHTADELDLTWLK
jgi:hypothetical protein